MVRIPNKQKHISRIIYFLNNGEKYKMHKIDWCEGGLQLSHIANQNVGENYLSLKNEIYYGKILKLRHNTCIRGVK